MSLGILVVGAVGGALLVSTLRSRSPEQPASPDTTLRIEILNGCGSPGVADRVALIVRRAGYQVERTGNADHFHYGEDLVVARRVSLDRVLPLARILGAQAIEQQISGDDVDVTVVVGKPRSLVPAND
jgi:polyisoprenyl-teichoic acid--peptidoglycan teichoic acid transferase